MKYYRDVDYFIYFEEFPHMGISGVIVSNSDGTVNIYINTLYSVERQRKTIQHELRHLVKGHLYCDILSIEEKELEADDLEDDSYIFGNNFEFVEFVQDTFECSEPEVGCLDRIPDVFDEAKVGTIPYFPSLTAFRDYMFAMSEQYHRGHTPY